MQLKHLTHTDLTAIHHLFCVPAVYRYLADGNVPDPSIAEQWVNAGLSDHKNHSGGLWGLHDTTPERPLAGIVRLSDYADASLELTYLLHPEYWRRGLATQMAHTALSVAFANQSLMTIWAGADEPNTASIAVMERLGMTFRNNADYPAGPGVEYCIGRTDFVRARHPLLPVLPP